MKFVKVVLVLAIFTVVLIPSTSSAQDIDGTGDLPNEVFLPIHSTPRYNSVRFCTDRNANGICEWAEFFFLSRGIALIVPYGGEMEFVDIQFGGWVDYESTCSTTFGRLGCSAQGMSVTGLTCWISEPVAISDVAINIPMQITPLADCGLEIP